MIAAATPTGKTLEVVTGAGRKDTRLAELLGKYHAAQDAHNAAFTAYCESGERDTIRAYDPFDPTPQETPCADALSRAMQVLSGARMAIESYCREISRDIDSKDVMVGEGEF